MPKVSTTLSDLPDDPGQGSGRMLLLCSKCRGEYSASKSDYFFHPKNKPLICPCGGNLALVTKHTVYRRVKKRR